MGFYATEWFYGTAPEIPSGVSRHVGAATVRAVLGFLCHRADDETGEAYPSQSTIADALGVDRRDVRHALVALVDLGLIGETAPAIPRRRGATYRIALDRFGRDTPPESTDTNSGGIPRQSRGNSGGDSGGDSGGIPRRDHRSLTSDSELENGSSSRARASADVEGSSDERPDLERVRAILETNGAPRRLTTRGRRPRDLGGEQVDVETSIGDVVESWADVARRGGMG